MENSVLLENEKHLFKVRIKTKEEFRKEYGLGWREKLGDLSYVYSMDHHLGEYIEITVELLELISGLRENVVLFKDQPYVYNLKFIKIEENGIS
jgi:hypothetical protein